MQYPKLTKWQIIAVTLWTGCRNERDISSWFSNLKFKHVVYINH